MAERPSETFRPAKSVGGSPAGRGGRNRLKRENREFAVLETSPKINGTHSIKSILGAMAYFSEWDLMQ